MKNKARYKSDYIEWYGLFVRFSTDSKERYLTEDEMYEVWKKAKFGNFPRALWTIACPPYLIGSLIKLKRAQARARRADSIE